MHILLFEVNIDRILQEPDLLFRPRFYATFQLLQLGQEGTDT